MSGEDALPALSTWALLSARVAPSSLLLALATRGAVPLWIALGVGIAIAAGLVDGDSGAGAQPLVWAALLRELLLGLAFAAAAATPLFGLFAAARLAERSEPDVRSPLSTLYALAAALLVLSLGGLRAYVRALNDSLTTLPLASAVVTRAAFWAETQLIVAHALTAALALGLPLLTAIWLLDLTLALSLRITRSESKVEALPVRRALLLLLLVLCCAPWVSRIPELTRGALERTRDVAQRFAR